MSDLPLYLCPYNVVVERTRLHMVCEKALCANVGGFLLDFGTFFPFRGYLG